MIARGAESDDPCPGDLYWNYCASPCGPQACPTLHSLLNSNCIMMCESKCDCPYESPYLADDGVTCLTVEQCDTPVSKMLALSNKVSEIFG